MLEIIRIFAKNACDTADISAPDRLEAGKGGDGGCTPGLPPFPLFAMPDRRTVSRSLARLPFSQDVQCSEYY